MNSKEKIYIASIIAIASVSLFKFHEIAGWYGVAVSVYVYSNVALIAFIVGMKMGSEKSVEENANSIRRKSKQKTR